jgi:hypothetical protein
VVWISGAFFLKHYGHIYIYLLVSHEHVQYVSSEVHIESIVSITNRYTLYLVVLIQIKLFYSLRRVSVLVGTILREFPLYLAKTTYKWFCTLLLVPSMYGSI